MDNLIIPPILGLVGMLMALVVTCSLGLCRAMSPMYSYHNRDTWAKPRWVLRRLKPFGTPKILVNDVMPDHTIDGYLKVHWTTKNEIYKNADLISLHLPLNTKTKDMITAKELSLMKDNALLINTSRGGIINEKDLFFALKKGKLGGVAIDVFENEPYEGPLKNIERCLLTSHMGSMSEDCRTRMEIESTEEIVRFFNNEQLKNPVPESEYNIQKGFWNWKIF